MVVKKSFSVRFISDRFWSRHFRSILFLIVLFSLIFRILFLGSVEPFGFDSGVYLANGKFFFSGGEAGFFEHIRPPVTGLLAGFPWWIGLDANLGFFFFNLVFGLGSVILIALVGRLLFSSFAGLFSALVFASSSTFFFSSFLIQSELPGIFFFLLSLFFVLRNNFFFSGVFISLAFLSKFYYGLFFFIFALYLFWSSGRRKASFFGLGVSLFVVPYFIFSWVFLGSPFASLLDASFVAGSALWCNYFAFMPWHSYFLVFLAESFLVVFSVFALFRFRNVNVRLLFACLLPPLFYLFMISCRNNRYALLVFPLLVLLAGFGFDAFKKKFGLYFSLIIICLGVAFFLVNPFLSADNFRLNVSLDSGYYEAVKEVPSSEVIVSNNPLLSFLTDNRIVPAYYPLYNASKAQELILLVESGEYNYFFIDNCEGDLFCPPWDAECIPLTNELLRVLGRDYDIAFFEEREDCFYAVFTG